MQIHLSPEFRDSRDGQEAGAIVRKCVHCGFCTATCPTYQLLGDELDSPRGRIYLIKQLLEGGEVTRSTQQHLDRCLTCRNCETTCPSGVQYGKLIDIGRRLVDQHVERPAAENATRWLLKEGITSPLFAPALQMGQWLRPFLPPPLKQKVPPLPATAMHGGGWPRRKHPRKVLLLAGCVQPAILPNVNRATARVLDAAAIETIVANNAGCCGAIRKHLNDQPGAYADMRRNIDAWWPLLESGVVEAIVSNAAGCGLTVKEYGEALADDPKYAAKAARVSALTRDLSELLPDLLAALRDRVSPQEIRHLAFHPPCSLQHGQKLRGGVESALASLGFTIELTRSESHLCCGSAGTYSLLQPELAYRLRDRKLAQLAEIKAQCIVSANVGCIQHLQSGTSTPVRHWIEVLDEAILPA